MCNSELPLSSNFIQTDNDKIVLFTCKKAQDSKSIMIIMRNTSNKCEQAYISVNFLSLQKAIICDTGERFYKEELLLNERGFRVQLNPNDVITVILSCDL